MLGEKLDRKGGAVDMYDIDLNEIRNTNPKIYIEMAKSNGDIFIEYQKSRRNLCMLYIESCCDSSNRETAISTIQDRSNIYGVENITRPELYEVASLIVGILTSYNLDIEKLRQDALHTCDMLDDDTCIEVDGSFSIFDKMRYIPKKLARCYADLNKNTFEMGVLSSSLNQYKSIIDRVDDTSCIECERITVSEARDRLNEMGLSSILVSALSDIKELSNYNIDGSSSPNISKWKELYCMYIYLLDHAVNKIVRNYLVSLNKNTI